MSTANNKPILSVISLLTLLTNAVVVVASYLLLVNSNIFVIFFDFWVGIFLSALGTLFALVSLLRRERYLIVSLLALTLNCAPLIWLWSIRNKQLFGP